MPYKTSKLQDWGNKHIAGPVVDAGKKFTSNFKAGPGLRAARSGIRALRSGAARIERDRTRQKQGKAIRPLVNANKNRPLMESRSEAIRFPTTPSYNLPQKHSPDSYSKPAPRPGLAPRSLQAAPNTAPSSWGKRTYRIAGSGKRNVRVKMPFVSGESYRKENRPISPLQAQINENNKLLSAPIARGDNAKQRRATRQFLVNNANSDLVTKAMAEQGATHRENLQGKYGLARERMSGQNTKEATRIRGNNGLAISTQNNKGEDKRLSRKIDADAKEGTLDRENDREVAKEKTIRDSFISGVNGDDVEAMRERGDGGKINYSGKTVPKQQVTKSQWKQETDLSGKVTGYYDPITNQRRSVADYNNEEISLGLNGNLTPDNLTQGQVAYLTRLKRGSLQEQARHQRLLNQIRNPQAYIPGAM